MGFLHPTVYMFSLKHKSGKLNQVADALSRRATLLITVRAEVRGFKCLKELNEADDDFGEVSRRCNTRQPTNSSDAHLRRIFIPRESIVHSEEFLMGTSHSGIT